MVSASDSSTIISAKFILGSTSFAVSSRISMSTLEGVLVALAQAKIILFS